MNWSDWDNESRRRATSALAGISNFEFCVVFTTIVKSLFYLRGPSKKIQGRSLNLYNVVGQLIVTCDDLDFARSDEGKKFFARCFEYASEIAGLINFTPSMPRIAVRQQHRPNAESNTPFDFYRVNMCLPFLDHMIDGIDVRFDKYGNIVLAMAGLVPSLIAKNDVSVIDILDMYSDDLSSPGTVAVTLCECERSGSVLKRLNTYLRASMGQERMSGLAFFHINHDKNIDVMLLECYKYFQKSHVLYNLPIFIQYNNLPTFFQYR